MHAKILTTVGTGFKPVGTLVEEFLVYCESSRAMSPSTVKTRKTHLNQFARYCFERSVFDVSKLTPAFLDDYFAFYQTTHTPNTTNTGRRIMKVFLKWLSGYKEMSTVNPDTIRLVRAPKTLPKALDVKKVLEVISQCKNPQDALMINLLLKSGIRISELVAIRVEDVVGSSISIHGKGSIERVVYIPDELALKIEMFGRQNNRLAYEHLFQNVYAGYGEKMTIGTARLRIQKEFEKHGVKMHPHQLRHTFAVMLLKNGCDIVTIQKLLGHADVQTTMVYLNVSNSYLEERYKTFMVF